MCITVGCSRLDKANAVEDATHEPVVHDNIRGPHYYHPTLQ